MGYKWMGIVALSALSVMSITENVNAQQNDRKNKHKDKDTEKVVPKTLSDVDTLITPIPNNRYVFAQKVTKAIRAADARDGKVDNIIFDNDEAKSQVLTQVIMKDAALLLIKIENSTATHNNKIRYENALAALITDFNKADIAKVNPIFYKRRLENLEQLIIAVEENEADQFIRQNDNVYTLENIEVVTGEGDAKAYLFEKIGNEDPQMMIKRLPEFYKEPYADKIVASAAKVAPSTILTYATSTSALSNTVRRNQDPLVQSIVKISDQSRNPFKVLPFLNQIHDGSKTVAQIDAIAKDDDGYFKALVDLMVSGKALSDVAVEEEINYRSLKYVRRVNELHEATDGVRFKGIEQFNATELYFMMIGGQDEIYTSSYLGMFKRMMEKMKPMSGNEFLDKVRYSHFRTFIRMSAGYNTLSQFLVTMSETNQTDLMKRFVSNLEKGSTSDLTDAVDVADAFGSLKDEKLITYLKDEVRANYERVYRAKISDREKEKGIIVYGLLGTIFNNAGNSEQLEKTVSNIPPINYVNYSDLLNKDGKVVQQVYFYGDEDGKVSYSSFMSSFQNNKWKVDNSNPNWTTITSTSGKPVVIYANKPLTEPQDEKAQQELHKYLDANEINPAVVIHRGHSYHLEGSLENLNPSVKVVMLGSCGGYHNLAKVLDKSPDANIISSKQIGSYTVNEPIIREMNEFLLKGENINWLKMWDTLGKQFVGKGKAQELFNDYVPPNKNLGAIFIKAYRKMELASNM